MSDTRLASSRFPRFSRYNPGWIIASASGGANSLWLTEWLAAELGLKPGIKALEADRGRYLACVRMVGRRRAETKLEDRIESMPAQYTREPLLRDE